MQELKHVDELERWLEVKGRETAIVIAIRAALRVLPLGRVERSPQSLLSFFRVIAACWVDARYPDPSAVSSYSAVHNSASEAMETGHSTEFIARVHAAVHAATAVTATPAFRSAAVAVGEAAAAAGDIMSAVSSPTEDHPDRFADPSNRFLGEAFIWREVSFDATEIDSGLKPSTLVKRPLWQAQLEDESFEKYFGTIQPTFLAAEWVGLKYRLSAFQQNWDVWSRWYERIVDGRRPLSREVELFRVTLNKEDDWKRPPAEINAMIKAKIREVEGRRRRKKEKLEKPPELPELPRQSGVTEVFSTDPAAPVDLVVGNETHSLGLSLERQEGYDEIRSCAADLKGLGENRLGRLAGPCDRFLALASPASEVRRFTFWSRANILRNLMRDHEVAMATQEYDERRLDPVVAGYLNSFVDSFQGYCLGDIELMQMEQSRPGPRDVASAKDELVPLRSVIKALVSNQNLATTRAADVIEDAQRAIETSTDGLTSRQGAAFGRIALNNLVLALLVKARLALGKEAAFGWKEFRKGGYAATGALVISEFAGVTTSSAYFWQFISSHADALSTYAKLTAMNPAVVDFLRWIKHSFGA